MTEDERDEHLNRLAHKIGRMLDGENYFDVACVCALLTSFAIRERYPEFKDRITALDKIHMFMLERVSK